MPRRNDEHDDTTTDRPSARHERWYRLFAALSTEADGRRRRRLRRLLHEEEMREDVMFDGMCREATEV